MTWENKSFAIVPKTADTKGGFSFVYSGDNKYIRGNSELINYSIVDYELPLGFLYRDEKEKFKVGTTASSIIPMSSTTVLNFSNTTPLNSRTLAVHNRFTGEKEDTSVESLPMVVTQLSADTEVYDMCGRKVGVLGSNLPKGIYLVNGRKYFVK